MAQSNSINFEGSNASPPPDYQSLLGDVFHHELTEVYTSPRVNSRKVSLMLQSMIPYSSFPVAVRSIAELLNEPKVQSHSDFDLESGENLRSWINRMHQKYGDCRCHPEYTYKGPSHNPVWTCVVRYNGRTVQSDSHCKLDAYEDCLKILKDAICSDLASRYRKQADFDLKESRARQRFVNLKRTKEKNAIVLQKKYSKDKSEHDKLSCEVSVAVLQLRDILEQEGYYRHGTMSRVCRETEPYYVAKALKRFAQGYPLYNAHALYRLAQTGATELPASSTDPLPVGDSRLVLIRAWIFSDDPLSAQLRCFFPSYAFEKQGFMNWMFNRTASTLLSSFVDSTRQRITKQYNEFVDMLKSVNQYIPYVLLKYMAIGCTVVLIGTATYFLLDHLMPLKVPDEFTGFIKQSDDDEENPTVMNRFKKNMLYETATSLGKWTTDFANGLSPKAWVKEVNDFAKFTISLKNIAEFFRTIYDFFRACIDKVATWYTGKPYFKSSQDVESFMKTVKELSDLTRDQENLTADKAKTFIEKYDLCHRLLGLVKTWPNNSNERTLLTRTLLEGADHYAKCRAQIRCNRVRPDPVVIYLCGSSRAGKTTAKTMLFEAVYQRLYGEPMKIEQHYYRNAAQTHWDGYTNGVWAVTFDDMLQQKDQKVRALECMDLIRGANTDPLRLNMASLSDKADTFFEPRVIAITTNEKPFPHDLGIAEPKAFFRRRDFTLSVRLKPGSRRVGTPTAADSDNFIFTVYGTDGYGGAVPAEDCDVSFMTLVDLIANLVKHNNEGFEDRMAGRDYSEVFQKHAPSVESDSEEAQPSATGVGLDDSSDSQEYFNVNEDDDEFLLVPEPLTRTEKKKGSKFRKQCRFWNAPYNPAWLKAYRDAMGQPYQPLKTESTSDRVKRVVRKSNFYTDEPLIEESGVFDMRKHRYMLLHKRDVSFPTFLFYDIDPSAHTCLARRQMVALADTRNDYSIFCPSISEVVYYSEFTDVYLRYMGNPVLETLKSVFLNLEKVSLILLGGTAIGMLCFIMRSAFGDSCPAFFRQSEDPRSGAVQNVHRSTVLEAIQGGRAVPLGKRVQVLMNKPGDPTKQGSSHMGTKRVFHNIFYVCSIEKDRVLSTFFTLFITSNTAVCPHHCWQASGETINIQMVRSQRDNNVYVLKKADCIVTLHPNLDMVIFTVPPGNWLAMKDLTRHIPEKFITYEFAQACRLGYNADGSQCEMIIGPRVVPSTVSRNPALTEDFYYRIVGTMGDNGDCGLPYFALNNGIPDKLFAFHNGRQGNDSYATGLSMEVIRPHLNKVTSTYQQVGNSFTMAKPRFYEGCRVELQPADHEFQSLRVEYTTNRPPYCPNKTQLVASPLQTGIGDLPPIWPATEAPADLSREAMTNGFRKLAGKKWTSQLMLEDKEVWGGVFGSHFTDLAVKPLTMEQVCFGDPVYKGIGSYPPDSSNGYPWATEGITKDDLIRKPVNGDKGFIDPRLIAMVNLRKKYAVRRRLLPVLCQATLKDETRPLSRVKLKYTRVMFPAPIDSTAFEKMYWGYFVSQLESTIHGDCQVGLNAYGHAWTLLAKQLRQYSDELVAGDMDGWDIRTAVHVFAFNLWMHVCIYFGLDPCSEQALCMYAALMSASLPYIVVGKDVCYAPIQVSGRWSTSWLNSVINSVCTRLCFKHANLRAKTTHKGLRSYDFNDVCRLLVMGDDNIMAVRKEILSWWNGKVKADLMSELFFILSTAPDKSHEIKETYAFDKADFLSRRFIKDGSLYLAPLNEESMRNSVLWIRKSSTCSIYEQTVINIHNALFEWSLYDKHTYDTYRNLLNRYIREMGLHSKQFTHDWQAARNAYVNSHFHN